ncbi:MAG: hypothetical protein ACTH2Q_06420 [Propionibacteriaceae bacterium]
METWQIVVLVLVGIAVVVGGVLIFLRVRYIKAIRKFGWTFQNSIDFPAVSNLSVPPFGRGFDRDPDDLITGSTDSGVPFRSFEYKYADGNSSWSGRVATLHLPLPLPELLWSSTTPGPGRRGVQSQALGTPDGVLRAADPAYAQTFMTSSVSAALAALPDEQFVADVAVDGQHLALIGVPKKPEDLKAVLEKAGAVVGALDVEALQRFRIEPTNPGFRFYGRPDWVLVGSDNGLITKYRLTTAGHGHETKKVVRGANDGLAVEGFEHHWKTTRTETYTDSQGQSRTRTVTDHHSEVVCAVTVPFHFMDLSVNGKGRGEKVQFESEQFNDRYKVRTANPKFSYDVIHPRMMEWLTAVGAPGFTIERGFMRFYPGRHDTEAIGWAADFAHEFFDRVPSFVWKDLQVTPLQFRVAAPV